MFYDIVLLMSDFELSFITKSIYTLEWMMAGLMMLQIELNRCLLGLGLETRRASIFLQTKAFDHKTFLGSTELGHSVLRLGMVTDKMPWDSLSSSRRPLWIILLTALLSTNLWFIELANKGDAVLGIGGHWIRWAFAMVETEYFRVEFENLDRVKRTLAFSTNMIQYQIQWVDGDWISAIDIQCLQNASQDLENV